MFILDPCNPQIWRRVGTCPGTGFALGSSCEALRAWPYIPGPTDRPTDRRGLTCNALAYLLGLGGVRGNGRRPAACDWGRERDRGWEGGAMTRSHFMKSGRGPAARLYRGRLPVLYVAKILTPLGSSGDRLLLPTLDRSIDRPSPICVACVGVGVFQEGLVRRCLCARHVCVHVPLLALAVRAAASPRSPNVSGQPLREEQQRLLQLARHITRSPPPPKVLPVAAPETRTSDPHFLQPSLTEASVRPIHCLGLPGGCQTPLDFVQDRSIKIVPERLGGAVLAVWPMKRKAHDDARRRVRAGESSRLSNTYTD